MKLAQRLRAIAAVLTPARVLREGTGTAGLFLIAFGFHEAWRPLGWIVGGVELVGVALLVAFAIEAARREAEKAKPPG